MGRYIVTKIAHIEGHYDPSIIVVSYIEKLYRFTVYGAIPKTLVKTMGRKVTEMWPNPAIYYVYARGEFKYIAGMKPLILISPIPKFRDIGFDELSLATAHMIRYKRLASLDLVEEIDREGEKVLRKVAKRTDLPPEVAYGLLEGVRLTDAFHDELIMVHGGLKLDEEKLKRALRGEISGIDVTSYSPLEKSDVPLPFKVSIHVLTARKDNIAQLLGSSEKNLLPEEVWEKLKNLRGTRLIEF